MHVLPTYTRYKIIDLTANERLQLYHSYPARERAQVALLRLTEASALLSLHLHDGRSNGTCIRARERTTAEGRERGREPQVVGREARLEGALAVRVRGPLVISKLFCARGPIEDRSGSLSGSARIQRSCDCLMLTNRGLNRERFCKIFSSLGS